ncbi:glycosyltransferase family 4 protein [Oleidesulfovibrio sp.]|uniref:glycosyltransferase family 4 protein n=1 Tax=Oleidesulfovibrio sp. TaxID=2909707 RepID=UPI003A846B42
MRIILATSSTNKSGGSRQALYLAQGLKARGHDVTFFTETKAALRELDPDMNWGDLPKDKKKWRKAVEEALPPVGTDGQPAIFHAFHNKAVKKAAWWGVLWRRRNVVCIGHRGVVYRPGNPLPYLSPGISAFIVNSKACADVLRWYCLGSSRIKVVYNGIPHDRSTPQQSAEQAAETMGLSIAATDIVYGTVAGDNPIKGTEILLRGFAQAQLTDAKCIVIGVTPKKWQPLCDELGISNAVKLVGKTECVADYLQLMDVFVLPSLTESMPNTLMEAIRMGLPAIATRVGGVPELVQGNGILIPASDSDAMSCALRGIHNTPKQRETWAAASRALAPQYDMERRVEIIENIYRQQLKRRGLPDN